MKIEKRNNHKKKIVIGGMIVTSALVVGILATSYSKYRVTENVKLGEGIINYSSADFELVGMYLINEDNTETKINTVPGTGYVLNAEKTKCTVNDSEVAASIEYKNNKLYFGDITEKGTKCKVYFNKKKGPFASETILGGNNPILRNNTFTSVATTSDDTGIYKTQDDWGESVYYRGVINNNWVDFAGFKWRIIRINGDGSIRMIYNGTSYATTGTGTQLTETSAFNTNWDDNAYIGYMYGTPNSSTYEETHKNINSSRIKIVLENWYNINLLEKYDKFISKEAGFCGDRQIGKGSGGYGSSNTYYASFTRLWGDTTDGASVQTVTLNCNTNDLYTVSASSKGNHALTYPIGLITSDEVVFAGGMGGQVNQKYWLYTGQEYWTMSPFLYNGPTMFEVRSDGKLRNTAASFDKGNIRPVINLASDVQLTGSGTTTDPYKIVE